MPGKNKLEGLNIKAIRQELADRTDDFRIGQRMKRINLNTTKQLVMNITVYMFNQLCIGKVGIGLQDHQGYFTFGRKITFTTQRRRLQMHLSDQFRKREESMEST